MQLTINGELRTVTGPATVAGVLQELGLDPRAVVVELNREIIRRPAAAATPVADGDVVEIVHFVGGG